MSSSLLYKLQSKIFDWIGDIRVHPFPMFFLWKNREFKIKGYHIEQLYNLIQPGDILLSRDDRALDAWFIPGWWTHAGIYIGEMREPITGRFLGKHCVVHAISQGVVCDNLIDFCHADHVVVLRAPLDAPKIQDAVCRALNAIGTPYDFGFDFENDSRFACTELVYHCYEPYKEVLNFHLVPRLGKLTFVSDDIVYANLGIVWVDNLAKDRIPQFYPCGR